MHTSGLVISFAEDPAAEAARRDLSVGPFALGEVRGGCQAAVLETTGPNAAHDWHDWAAALPGVVGVEVVFVHWDAAGQEVTLGAGAGDSIRLELLGIVFKSVGLPEQYSRAAFVMWLRDEGVETAVRDAVTAAGGDFDEEVANLYVSDRIAKALLAAKPGFANTPAETRLLLQKQFPNVPDVSAAELVKSIRRAVGKNGKLPCTIIVLDEVQQYIGDDVARSKGVQDIQEQCCAQLGSALMIVATGQNALSGTAHLQRLQGRFPVTVELQDTDVEQVTREVVLKKKPSAEPGLQKLLDKCSGEVERQLAGTNIAFTSRDSELLVKDYPILPVRRRFWERVLRAVDRTMTGAQLRSQLRIVHEAVRDTADAPLGTVVGAAFIYPHILSRVLQSGILLQEIAENIAMQAKEEAATSATSSAP